MSFVFSELADCGHSACYAGIRNGTWCFLADWIPSRGIEISCYSFLLLVFFFSLLYAVTVQTQHRANDIWSSSECSLSVENAYRLFAGTFTKTICMGRPPAGTSMPVGIQSKYLQGLAGGGIEKIVSTSRPWLSATLKSAALWPSLGNRHLSSRINFVNRTGRTVNAKAQQFPLHFERLTEDKFLKLRDYWWLIVESRMILDTFAIATNKYRNN